jgi:putative hydrolase of the HAD superfamily
MPIRAVIFDFGGVIVPGSPANGTASPYAAIEQAHGLPAGFLWKAVYLDNPAWMRLRVGDGTEADWFSAARSIIAGVTGDERADVVVEAVLATRAQGKSLPGTGRTFNDGIIELIERLRGNVRVGLLSNAAPGLEDDLRDYYGIAHLFDDIINSATVRLAKPDHRVYHLAAARHGVAPRECFFTDDLLHNVVAAREVGFTAHQFDGCDGLVEALRSAGVEPG